MTCLTTQQILDAFPPQMARVMELLLTREVILEEQTTQRRDVRSQGPRVNARLQMDLPSQTMRLMWHRWLPGEWSLTSNSKTRKVKHALPVCTTVSKPKVSPIITMRNSRAWGKGSLPVTLTQTQTNSELPIQMELQKSQNDHEGLWC